MRNVLLIHPDFYARVHIDDSLTTKQFSVATVKNHELGLVKLRGQRFHLVIISLTLTLPAVIGFIATTRERYPEMPVIILTPNIVETQARQLGRFRHLEVVIEPFSLLDLVKKMEALILEVERDQKRSVHPRTRA